MLMVRRHVGGPERDAGQRSRILLDLCGLPQELVTDIGLTR